MKKNLRAVALSTLASACCFGAYAQATTGETIDNPTVNAGSFTINVVGNESITHSDPLTEAQASTYLADFFGYHLQVLNM